MSGAIQLPRDVLGLKTPLNIGLIDKAIASESLQLVSKSDNVFTWIGPSTVLLLFFTIVVLIAVSLNWFLADGVTEGWIQFDAGLTAFLAVLAFFLYYAVVKAGGEFVLAHYER